MRSSNIASSAAKTLEQQTGSLPGNTSKRLFLAANFDQPEMLSQTLDRLKANRGKWVLSAFIFQDLLKLNCKLLCGALPAVVTPVVMAVLVKGIDKNLISVSALAFPWLNVWINSGSGLFLILPALMKTILTASQQELSDSSATATLKLIGEYYRQGMLLAATVGLILVFPQLFSRLILENIFAVSTEVAASVWNFTAWSSFGVFLSIIASVQQMVINVSEDTLLMVVPPLLRLALELGGTYLLWHGAYSKLLPGLSNYALIMDLCVACYLLGTTLVLARRKKFRQYDLFAWTPFSLNKIKQDKISEIFFLGLPVALRVFVDIGFRFVIARDIEHITVSAHYSFQMIIQPLSFLLPVAFAMQQGLVMRTATLGAQKAKYIKHYFRGTFFLLSILYGMALVLLLCLREKIIHAFNHHAADSALIEISERANPANIFMLWLEQFCWALNMNCVAVLRGCRITWRPFLFNLFFMGNGVIAASLAEKFDQSYELVTGLWTAGVGLATVCMLACMYQNMSPARQSKPVTNLWQRILRSPLQKENRMEEVLVPSTFRGV